MIPGWPYSVVVALEPGRTSWTLPLDAVRLGPADDATAVTAVQVRGVVTRLVQAGHWRDGDPEILIVFDADYDLTRLAWLLAGLPVEVLGRLRSDRVLYFPAPAREPGTNGRPVRHGAAFRLTGKQPWPAPAVTTVTETTRYGTAAATAWGRLHQRLTSRAGWEEHTFRFFKQILGWTRSKLRDPASADRWTWIVIANAQLWLARPLAADLRLPWQRPCLPGRLTPARVRRGLRNIPPGTARSGQRAETRQTRPRTLARIEEPPPGHGHTRHDVGKTVKRDEPSKKTRRQKD